MPEINLIIFAGVAVFFSAMIQGTTGFGFVIVAAPILLVLFDPSLVVPVLVLQGFLLALILLIKIYALVDLKRIWPLVLSGIIFTPLGTYFLVNLNAGVLKTIIGVVVGLTAIGMFTGLQLKAKNEKLLSIPVGALSGLLIGSTGLAGAPVILFFTNQDVEPQRFRANITFYLQSVSIVVFPAFFISGVLTSEVFILSGLLFPASLAGLITGIWLHSRVSQRIFRKIALAVVLISAIAAILSGLTSFL
tara:strand:- start:1283 stop:2026 length:744 start_codon:yes stop_codon:yes gene_type:complete